MATTATIVTPGQPGPLGPNEFVPTPATNIVSFGLQQVGPPSTLYLQRDDVLSVVMTSLVAQEVVTVSGRLLLAASGVIVPFSVSLKAPFQNASVSQALNLGEGYLLGIAAVASRATQRGQTFVTIGLQRGALTLGPLSGITQTLFSDYITGNQPGGWPGGAVSQSALAPGAIGIFQPSNPAAGQDFILNNISGPRYRLLAVRATLATSATAANRQVRLFIGSGPTFAAQVGAPSNVTAGQTVTFQWLAGVNQYNGADGAVYVPLPDTLWVTGTQATFASSTANIQTGDQWSNISGTLEQLCEPA